MDAVVGIFWCCLVYVYVEEDEQSPGGSNVDILVWARGKQDGLGELNELNLRESRCALCKWSLAQARAHARTRGCRSVGA